MSTSQGSSPSAYALTSEVTSLRKAAVPAFGFLVDPWDGRVKLVHNGPSSKESLEACSDSQLTDLLNIMDETAPRAGPSRDANFTTESIDRLTNGPPPKFVLLSQQSADGVKYCCEEGLELSWIDKRDIHMVCDERFICSNATVNLQSRLRGHIGEGR